LHGRRHCLWSLLTPAAAGLALPVLLLLLLVVVVVDQCAMVLQHAWTVELACQLHPP
jgi:hypothetical protein